MAKAAITTEIQKEVSHRIDAFNKQTFKGSPHYMYVPRFKGNFLYLDRIEYGQVSPVARLKYTGNIKKWEFAIFKWSSETYDPDEWFFPGAGHADGTIEGAMKAGLEAYPLG